MNYYQDITLLPDADITLGFIWQKVYQQIHLALVENKIAENQSAVAVGFPKYINPQGQDQRKDFPLGNKLRLFAQTEEALQQLKIESWLSRLTDYCHIKSIQPVPDNIGAYVCFKRKHFKSNLLKEAKRRAKYKNETQEEALQHFQHYQKECKLPYINMSSLSMQKRNSKASRQYKLFISRETGDNLLHGEFNCFGLSKAEKTATIPWF